jgi:hypothetical protein
MKRHLTPAEPGINQQIPNQTNKQAGDFMGVLWLLREIDREQGRRRAGQHASWPDEWKQARAAARIACQQNASLNYEGTAERVLSGLRRTSG